MKNRYFTILSVAALAALALPPAFATNFNADFSTGGFNGWQYRIGETSLVTSIYGAPVDGYAAIIRTNGGGGAAPIADMFSYLEAQGIHMGTEFDTIRNTAGAVGSAIVTSSYTDSLGGLDITAQWLSNSDTVGTDRGAFAMIVRQSDGMGFVQDLGGSNLGATGPSATPYLFQSQMQTIEHLGSQEDLWRIAIWTWELNPAADGAGFSLLVDTAATSDAANPNAVPDVSNTLGLMALAVIGLATFRRNFVK